MDVRVPQDVDMEDRLIYGLTPGRLCCLLVAGLVALAAWRAVGWQATWRVGAALACLALGAVLAWGRWRGRPLDRWLADAGLFAARRLVRLPTRRPCQASAEPLDLDPINLLTLVEPSGPGWEEPGGEQA